MHPNVGLANGIIYGGFNPGDWKYVFSKIVKIVLKRITFTGILDNLTIGSKLVDIIFMLYQRITSTELRKAQIENILKICSFADMIRCDMAHLVLNEFIERVSFL